MTEIASDLPAVVRDLIGKPHYVEQTEFPIEIGYVYNMCAAVQDGNPLYWDPEVAREITGGQIAPPAMLSVWFKLHHWMPGAAGERRPMQLYFDIKDMVGLPEGIVASNEASFGEPVRIGDVLTTSQYCRSLGELKDTKLGRGRFCTMDIVTVNQRGEWCGTDTYNFLIYIKGAR